jgi:hypothetical protein
VEEGTRCARNSAGSSTSDLGYSTELRLPYSSGTMQWLSSNLNILFGNLDIISKHLFSFVTTTEKGHYSVCGIFFHRYFFVLFKLKAYRKIEILNLAVIMYKIIKSNGSL